MPFTADAPRLWYDVEGEDGPPVLFMMGLGMRGRVWQHQLNGLRASHRCCIYDNRGVGESELMPARERSARLGMLSPGLKTLGMKALAHDGLRVLDSVGWPSAHVVGVSLGGMVAQELALAAPERVRSLTLIATTPGGATGWIPPLRGVPLFVRANLYRDKRRVEALSRLLYPEHFLAAADLDAMTTRMREQFGRPAPRRSVLAQLSAVLRHTTLRRLHRIEAPTLVIRPGLDVLVRPIHSERIARAIPHAELLDLPDAGHGLIFQHAERVNAALQRHIAKADVRND
jgi:pimeloyl-ACP methyl ester carboxylesterase